MHTTNVHGCGMPPGAEMAMDEGKMAEVEALSVSMGNVLEACRRCGVSRSLFYKWLRLRNVGASGGGAGTEGAPPSLQGARRRHPHALPDELPLKAMALALEYPEWGCDRISHYLKLQGFKMSPTTIQKVLTRNGMRTRQDRETAGKAEQDKGPRPPLSGN
jgi:transposase-like protein